MLVPEEPLTVARQFHRRECMPQETPCPVGTPEPRSQTSAGPKRKFPLLANALARIVPLKRFPQRKHYPVKGVVSSRVGLGLSHP